MTTKLTEMELFTNKQQTCSTTKLRKFATITLILTIVGSTHGHTVIKENNNCQNRVPKFKVDCHPEQEVSESVCLLRGCCWATNNNDDERDKAQPPYLSEPSCFFPSDFQCFDITNTKYLYDADDDNSWTRLPRNLRPLNDTAEEDGTNKNKEHPSYAPNGISFLLVRNKACPSSGLPDDAEVLEVVVGVYGETVINIKISEKDRWRFEPRLPEIRLPSSSRRKIKQVNGNLAANDQAERKLQVGQLNVVVVQTNTSVLKVIHRISGAILFETDLGKLIYSRRFIQLPTSLASPYIYGLGQHMGESLLKSSGRHYAKSYTMFNFGHPPLADGRTAYSTYPFYVNLAQLPSANTLKNDTTSTTTTTTDQNLIDDFERRRKLMAIGGLMLNTNAMDVLVHSPTGGLTWRLVGGYVDLFLFVGPKPHDVVYQYQSLVGQPALPPAWALGYHQSRLNYRELLPIKLAWARTRSAGIPMESIWTDLEFLWRGTSYSLNNHELNDLVKVLQNEYDMHYVPLVDPAISVREDGSSYEALKLADSMDLFAYYPPINGLGESSRAIMTTWCESKQSGLLDFTHPLIVGYLEKVLADYHTKLSFDGLWLDMNEPEIFVNEPDKDGIVCRYDEWFPYLPGGRQLNERTMCMAAEFRAGRHYDIHNLYAFYQSKAHYDALQKLQPTKRPFIISRSHFVGQGKYSGSWLGDASSNFWDLRWSLIGTIESNWFGQPMTGSDICGFFGSTTDELCARWFSLGAFYPFARNHNDGSSKNQDPGALDDTVQTAARLTLLRRYSLLPYLYTLFHRNHRFGEPVVRSVLFEFFEHFYLSQDLNSLPQVDDQLMWGSAIMVAPVLEQGSEFRSVYLPRGRWYDISLGLPGSNMDEGVYDTTISNWPLDRTDIDHGSALKRLKQLRKSVDCLQDQGCWLQDQYTPLGAVNVYLRGGNIVPTFRYIDHNDSVGKIWRKASFFLEVAPDFNNEAYGTLYWDSGESQSELNQYSRANFWLAGNTLSITLVEQNFEEPLKFDGFVIYGVKSYELAHEPVVYGNASLLYTHNADTETLVCSFVELNDETRRKPLIVNKFDKLRFTF